MTLTELVETVDTKHDLAEFIRALSRDILTNKVAWENPDLQRYLDALSTWTDEMDGYFRNVRGVPPPDQPTWRIVGYMLLAARTYE
jgi:hypothetical protein